VTGEYGPQLGISLAFGRPHLLELVAHGPEFIDYFLERSDDHRRRDSVLHIDLPATTPQPPLAAAVILTTPPVETGIGYSPRISHPTRRRHDDRTD
jgi:hypothetical protein